jgi:hypothetical protein
MCYAYITRQQHRLKMKMSVEITVERVDGTTEVVRRDDINSMSPSMFKQMASTTLKAGRGRLIGYTNIQKTVALVKPTQAELDRADYERSTAAIYRAMEKGE